MLKSLFTALLALSSHLILTETAKYGQEDGYIIELISLCSKHPKYFSLPNAYFHVKFLQWIGVTKGNRNQKTQRYIEHKTYDVCNSSILLLKALADIVLNKKFKNTQHVTNPKQNQCSKIICDEDPAIKVLAITSFMPKDMTKLATEVLSMVPTVPFFAYTKNTEAYLSSIHPSFISPYNMLHIDINIIEKQIIDFDISHIALVIIGESKFATFHRQEMWDTLVKYKHLCIDKKDIEGGNFSKIANYMHEVVGDDTVGMVLIWDMRDLYSLDSNNWDLVHFTYGIYNKIWYWYPDLVVSSFMRDVPSLATNFIIKHPFFDGNWKNTISRLGSNDNVVNSTSYEILEDKYVKRLIAKKEVNKNNFNIFKDFDKTMSIINVEVDSVLILLFMQIYDRKSLKPSEFTQLAYFQIHYSIDNTPYTSRRCTNYFNVTQHMLRKVQSTHVNVCTKLKCQPGLESRKQIFKFTNDETRYAWICIPCLHNRTRTRFNISFSECKEEWISNDNNTSSIDQYNDRYLKISNKVSIILLLFIAPSFTFNLVSIVACVIYRDTPIIRSSGSHRSITQLISHLILYIAILSLYIVKFNAVYCTLQVVVTTLLLTIIMSVTITKTQTFSLCVSDKSSYG